MVEAGLLTCSSFFWYDIAMVKIIEIQNQIQKDNEIKMGKTSDFKLRLTKWIYFATDNNSLQAWTSFLIFKTNLYIVLYVNLTEISVILCK